MSNKSGVTFEYQQKLFSLVDFEWGKDNSFYFMPHQHEVEVGQRIVSNKDQNGNLKLNIKDVQSGCFPTKKISRHPSGYFHIKDTVGSSGNREKDGLIGPSFGEIDAFYTFLVICPQSIGTLVQVEQANPAHVIVHLPNLTEPFTVQFAIWDKKRNVSLPAPPETFLGNGVITLQIDNLDYGLVIMLPKVKTTFSGDFPIRTCYIVR
jgi:hypothetical protein